jgi:uncharacterized membrane protein YgdD (TMEM256/DUF423 family)
MMMKKTLALLALGAFGAAMLQQTQNRTHARMFAEDRSTAHALADLKQQLSCLEAKVNNLM